MRSVHYFPRYSQKENVVTNNSLLLLFRLLDYSKTKFEKAIETLVGETEVAFEPQWLTFGQQRTTGLSVVDGYIGQESVKIVIETKLHENFDPDQLSRHLAAFDGEQHQFFVLLSPLGKACFRVPETFCQEAAKRNIAVLQTSFESLISSIRTVLSPQDEEMAELVADYEAFCSITNLLPNDEYSVFVPPCGPSYPDNEHWQLYYCPANRTRRRTRYLGIYANREVRSIGRIGKVVCCSISDSWHVTVVDGPPLTPDEENRVAAAAANAPAHGWNIQQGHKFFICDEWSATSFRKSTPNGIQGHRYFDLRKFLDPVPSDLLSIAAKLRSKTWQ